MRWVLGSFIILLIVAFVLHERWITPQAELSEVMQIYADVRMSQLRFEKRFGRFASGPELSRSETSRLPNPCDGDYCLTVVPSVSGYNVLVAPDRAAAENRRRRLWLYGDESGSMCIRYGGFPDVKIPRLQQ